MSNPLVVNPKTGFLESISPHQVNPQRNYFNSERKLMVLSMIDEAIKERRWPTINEICAIAGVKLKSFTDHLKIDQAFAREWEERRLQLMSVYTGKLAQKAESKMGTLANLAMLRWLETGSWSPETRVNHISDGMGSKSVISTLGGVVDAEIVGNSEDIPSALPSRGDAPK